MRHAPHVFAIFAVCLLLGFPLSDTDLWWHLAAGREMVAAGSWLRQDPFCSSSLAVPWTDLHWGFQILVHSVHAVFAEFGLMALRILLVSATVSIALRTRFSWESAGFAGLVVFASRTFLDLRPLLPTLACIALLWTLLEARRSRWNLLAIVSVQVVLVNIQGLFLLGPLVCFAHATGKLLEGDRKPALLDAGLACAMLAASMVNPWGSGAFELATRVAGRILPVHGNPYSWEISENLPLVGWLRESPLRALSLAWWAVGLAWLWRPGRGAAGRGILLGGMAILAAMAVRNLPLLAVASLLCVRPRPLAGRWPRFASAAAILILAATTAMADRRWNLPGGSVSPLQSPPESTRRILSSRPAPVFHELRLGGWLSWNLPRPGLCWADTRLVLHDETFLRSLLGTLDHPERFDAWSRERGFAYALLPVSSWPRNRPLVVHLLRSSDWKVLDTDGSWILFARTRPLDGSTAPGGIGTNRPTDPVLVEGRIHERFGANPRLAAFVRRQWRGVIADAGRSP